MKAILALALSLSIGVCVLGCPGAMAMQHASRCCKSMPCSHNGRRAQNCCMAMGRMQTPVVQTHPVQPTPPQIAGSPVLHVVAMSPLQIVRAAIAINSHSPPSLALCSSVPLRI